MTITTNPFYKEPITLGYDLVEVPNFDLFSLICLVVSKIEKNCKDVNFYQNTLISFRSGIIRFTVLPHLKQCLWTLVQYYMYLIRTL